MRPRCSAGWRKSGMTKKENAVSLIVYEHPLSPYAQKVKIALDEKGIAYEPRMPVAIGSGQPDREFLKANPRGEVPALIDGDDCDFRFHHHPRIYRGQMADAIAAAEIARRIAPRRAPSKR